MDDVVGEEDDQPSSLGKKHITKLYTFPRLFSHSFTTTTTTTTIIDRYDVKRSFFFVEKLLQKARGVQEQQQQQPLLSQIRREGVFKSVDHIKTAKRQDEMKPKYNLVCIGSTKDQKNRMILSERVQSEHSWSTVVLTKAPLEVQKKIKQIATDKPKHKRMLTMSSKNFTFECQSQIKQKITIFEDSICSEQDVSEMPTHQIRFDDDALFLITLITTIFNHGSQLDPHQLVNILLPLNKNSDSDIVGRKCTIQPLEAYQPVLLKLLQYTYCMCKRVNHLMKDSEETLGHMDVCLGKALFKVVSSYDTDTRKGRNELFKLFFDRKAGAIGGIYEDVDTFKIKHSQVHKIFENAIEQLI